MKKGDHVRVLAGAMKDRVGVVADLDGRGEATVQFGPLKSKIGLNDLAPVKGPVKSMPIVVHRSHRAPMKP